MKEAINNMPALISVPPCLCGVLSFDDPLSKFFPQLPSDAKTITVRHLLTGWKDSWFQIKHLKISKLLILNSDPVYSVPPCQFLYLFFSCTFISL
jgi:hypothetical protein